MSAIGLLTRGYICGCMKKIALSVPLPPAEAQSLLVKALSMPLPPTVTEALGIHQSDVIIHTALTAAIADMRANPWLLDYVFASLPRDAVSLKAYGEKEVARAKEWFTTTNIPVVMRNRLDEVKLPAISIGLLESVESDTTLGDVHYVPQEDTEASWPVLAGPFSPVSYNAATGIMVIPSDIGSSLVVAAGMVIIDRVGVAHEITDVLDSNTLVIRSGTVADFGSALLKTAKPALITQLESLAFRETYSIGCHAQGEPVFLTYLHSIVTFVLLRYKEALLEARGFERSTVSSSDFRKNEEFGNEMVYSRYINLTGYVRQFWPKAVSEKLRRLDTEIVHQEDEPAADTDSLLWHGKVTTET